jgi:transketolase
LRPRQPSVNPGYRCGRELDMLNSRPYHPPALRKAILDMAFAGSTVHIGCAFSIVEILAVLHRSHLRYPENNPKHADRDFLVLSKGHGVMAQYACMHERGWLTKSALQNYFGDGTHLRGLGEVGVVGLEVTSGSLGHGLSVGAGLALAAKLKQTSQIIYAIIGDGEANEGPIWEAMLFAAHFRLDNLLIVIDKNDFQAMGATRDVLDSGDLVAKFQAFDFDTEAVDGHDEAALDSALNRLKNLKNGRPKAIIAQTVKGRGVSFMEGDNKWHYTRLTPETYAAAVREVENS